MAVLSSVYNSDDKINIDTSHCVSQDGTNFKKTFLGYGESFFKDYADFLTSDIVADTSHIASLTSEVRLMIRFVSRYISNMSVFLSKNAVRRISEFIQHQSLLLEDLNKTRYSITITGDHIRYLYLLCRIII